MENEFKRILRDLVATQAGCNKTLRFVTRKDLGLLKRLHRKMKKNMNLLQLPNGSTISICSCCHDNVHPNRAHLTYFPVEYNAPDGDDFLGITVYLNTGEVMLERFQYDLKSDQ